MQRNTHTSHTSRAKPGAILNQCTCTSINRTQREAQYRPVRAFQNWFHAFCSGPAQRGLAVPSLLLKADLGAERPQRRPLLLSRLLVGIVRRVLDERHLQARLQGITP